MLYYDLVAHPNPRTHLLFLFVPLDSRLVASLLLIVTLVVYFYLYKYTIV